MRFGFVLRSGSANFGREPIPGEIGPTTGMFRFFMSDETPARKVPKAFEVWRIVIIGAGNQPKLGIGGESSSARGQRHDSQRTAIGIIGNISGAALSVGKESPGKSSVVVVDSQVNFWSYSKFISNRGSQGCGVSVHFWGKGKRRPTFRVRRGILPGDY